MVLLLAALGACGGGGDSSTDGNSSDASHSTDLSITTQPQGNTVQEGNAAHFSVTAAGTGTLTYQWYKNGNPVSGANGPTLTLPQVALSDSGALLRVVVGNATGSVTSDTATLTVSPAPAPAITAQPQSATVLAGNNGTFHVGASGSDLRYQWQVSSNLGASWTDITGANQSAFSVEPLATASGVQFRVQVSNSSGTANSAPATLIVYLPESGVEWKAKITVAAGEQVALDASRILQGYPGTTSVAWTFDMRPDISAAELTLSDAAHANFVADIPGHYIVTATGDDGTQALWTRTFLITRVRHQRTQVVDLTGSASKIATTAGASGCLAGGS